jgi:hypothetical protein
MGYGASAHASRVPSGSFRPRGGGEIAANAFQVAWNLGHLFGANDFSWQPTHFAICLFVQLGLQIKTAIARASILVSSSIGYFPSA